MCYCYCPLSLFVFFVRCECALFVFFVNVLCSLLFSVVRGIALVIVFGLVLWSRSLVVLLFLFVVDGIVLCSCFWPLLLFVFVRGSWSCFRYLLLRVLFVVFFLFARVIVLARVIGRCYCSCYWYASLSLVLVTGMSYWSLLVLLCVVFVGRVHVLCYC